MGLDNKGQIGFEVLLLTAIIIASTFWVGSYYFEIKDSTLALQLTKTHVLGKISEAESIYTIQGISFEETEEDAITLTLDMQPDWDCTADAFEATALKATIAGNTKYGSVAVEVDGIAIAC